MQRGAAFRVPGPEGAASTGRMLFQHFQDGTAATAADAGGLTSGARR